jgi:hypothetical protein
MFVCWNAGNRDMGDEGAIRIAEGLEKNTSLNELNLSCVFHLLYYPSIVAFLTV